MTHGIVSALARTQVGITDYQFFIQTDAAINPGNSGGALVDLDGRLVGINTAIFSRSGGSHGIGFAIPANMVRVVVASAEHGGKAVERPWLGATLQAVTPDIADSLGLKRPAGALVANVERDSPAAQAGLKAGDLIVSVDGQTVDDPNAFDYRFATKPLGGTAELGLLRAGKTMSAKVALRARARALPRDEITIRSRSPFSGAKVANLSPALADELQLRTPTRASSSSTSSTARSPAMSASSAATSSWRSTARRSPTTARSRRARPRTAAAARWRVIIRRGGQQISVAVFNGMTPRAKRAARRCSPPPASTRTRRARSPTGCARRSSTRSSARTICSAPTAR